MLKVSQKTLDKPQVLTEHAKTLFCGDGGAEESQIKL